MKKISIIGAGRIGSAIGKVLKNSGHEVLFWDNNPQKNNGGRDIYSIIDSADFLFLCIPSWSLRETIESIKEKIDKKTIIISLSKGIEEKSLKTPYGILKETLSKKTPFVILGGPLIAESIAEGGFGMGVASSKDKNTRQAIKELFSQTNIKIETSENPEDVSFSGILKNIYATLIGISTGVGVNENAIGLIASESIKEMSEILNYIYGNKDSAFKTECTGDFIATIFSDHSNNLKAGINIVKSGILQKSEGIISITPLVKILGKNYKDFRLLSCLFEIIENKSDPKKEIYKLL